MIVWVKDALRQEVRRILDASPGSTFISGMALGVDTWAAEVVLELGGRLVAATPFHARGRACAAESQRRWQTIVDAAADVVYVSQGPYAARLMQVRNEWMVD